MKTTKSKDMRLRVEPALYEKFQSVCEDLDLSVSHVVRRLMRQFVENAPANQGALWSPAGQRINPGDAGQTINPDKE